MAIGNADFHFSTLGQLAGNIVKQMRGYRRGAAGSNGAFNLCGNIHIHVGCGHQQHAALGLQDHIRQNGDGVAPLDNRLHLAKRPQEADTIYGQFHWLSLLFSSIPETERCPQASVDSSECSIAPPLNATHHKI